MYQAANEQPPADGVMKAPTPQTYTLRTPMIGLHHLPFVTAVYMVSGTRSESQVSHCVAALIRRLALDVSHRHPDCECANGCHCCLERVVGYSSSSSSKGRTSLFLSRRAVQSMWITPQICFNVSSNDLLRRSATASLTSDLPARSVRK